MTGEQQVAAAMLAEMARTGYVPQLVAGTGRGSALAMEARLTLASRLFLLDADLAPLIVLGVGLTGRNAETIKELPAAHTVLEDRAVKLEVVKRRRGDQRWFDDLSRRWFLVVALTAFRVKSTRKLLTK